jgi:DNA-binding SARP family transcriptional activator
MTTDRSRLPEGSAMTATGDCLRLELLGPVRAWRSGTEVVIGPPKQRAVLGLLASRVNEVVGVEQIVDAVWGSNVPQTGVNGVHTYVAGLRRALEPERGRRQTGALLVSAAGGYSLQMDRDRVDTELFVRRHAQSRKLRAVGDIAGALETVRSALSLWRGEAYAGVPGPFATVERARLHELRSAAVEELAYDMLVTGQHGEVIEVLANAVADEPLRERLRWLLMLALYRCGRQAHALQVYSQTRRLLLEELGIEPGTELRELHEKILCGQPDPGTVAVAEVRAQAMPRPAQLPPSARGFVGRTEELAWLQRLVTREEPRQGMATPIVVIDGAAGVGKTAFALQLTHLLADRFPDGQLFVDLYGSSPVRSPIGAFEALAALLCGLGVEESNLPTDLAGRAALYRSHLHRRRMLVVLDDAINAEQLRPLIPRGGCCVVVTSRRRQSGLAAHDGAHRIEVGPLSTLESVELFTYLIGKERTAGQGEAAAQLAELCGHLPLALRIAAESVAADPRMSLAQLVSHYRDRGSRLDRLTVDDDAVSSVRARLASSYRALPACAARLFRLLGRCTERTITVEDAATMLNTSVAEAGRQLDTLADRYLLTETVTDAYHLHDLVHLFAVECAAEEPLVARRMMRALSS